MPKKKGRNARNKVEDEDDKFDMGNVKDGVDEIAGWCCFLATKGHNISLTSVWDDQIR